MRVPARLRATCKIAVAVAASGVVVVAGPAAAAGGSFPGRGAQRPLSASYQGSFPPPGAAVLQAVAAASGTSAWAVGNLFTGTATQTLIEHWNGHAWRREASPNPAGSNTSVLSGVAAASPSSAWAVGYFSNGTATQTLIEHWSGHAWRLTASPNPGGPSHANSFRSVAATSPSNAWAVGSFSTGTADRTLIEHWNGRRWRAVASPNPAGSTSAALYGVAALSASSAWAVGIFFNGTAIQTLIEHWNGHAWRRVASPNPAGSSHTNELFGVAATSPSSAWAAGSFSSSTADRTLFEHWNGHVWRRVASPTPAGSSIVELDSIAAASRSAAWAVGNFFDGAATQTLIEHWNGHAWRPAASPDPGGSSNSAVLAGVAVTSPSSAWAVGDFFKAGVAKTLIVRWNGTKWRQVTSP